jgi:alpha-N-arabinofuranosidase
MARLIVDTLHTKNKINKNIYGHFSEHLGHCIYGGLYVGSNSEIPNVNGIRSDAVKALKKIGVPVLRWPGGCFADTYHWKDGIGSKEGRKKIVNTTWGGVVEDNSFGTHEFMELCRQIGCEPYVCGNVGSGTVREMSEWVEYMNFGGISPMADLRRENGREEPWGVKYFGVGNESWGGGGNMRPEYYADVYRRYQTYLYNYGANRLFKIASGPNVDDYDWTAKVMESAGRFMDGIALHYYTIPGTWKHKGSATAFNTEEYYETLKKALRMDELISRHTHVMEKYDPEHRVGLVVDEWGTWYDVEPGTNPGFLYQQNTMRDALVAAVTLNIFNAHSDRVVMANLAQMVNVLQSVLLTDGEKMLLTPTYHVFDLYKRHQSAKLVENFLQCGQACEGEWAVPKVSCSASLGADGKLTLTLANLSADEPEKVNCTLLGAKAVEGSARILSGAMGAKNTFASPDTVEVRPFHGISVTEEGLGLTIPACSVLEIVVELK